MTTHWPRVDVFVTACGESHALIEQCLQAACQMRGDHNTWLLDDGNDPVLALLAQRLGAQYLTRTERTHAKAGNLNAALARTTGEIVVIFDIDHIPCAEFLEQTLPLFANPKIGFVQVMLTFSNSEESWIARAAIESSKDFYTATSIGSDSIRGATLVGSNALIRRSALASIGGYQPGLAEDLATSIALHAAGWGSVYVRRPLAPGLAPPDLAAWFTQQLKWAHGVFDLLLTSYPKHFLALALGQKISYAVRMTYYWIGPMVGLHLLATLITLYAGQAAWLAALNEYLLFAAPLVFMILLIRDLSFRQWRHPTQEVTSQWRAVTLIYATWPVYTLAWLMALLRVPLAFRPTPKTADGHLNPLWLAPQLTSVLLLINGIVTHWTQVRAYPLIILFAIAQAIPQLVVVCYWFWTVKERLLRQPDLPKSNHKRELDLYPRDKSQMSG
jgi:cellulose synthase (UDP-forming)